MRKDGRKLSVRETNPMYTVVPYIMPKRSDAMNMIELFIPEKPLHDYINAKRAEGLNISHMALIMAAYVRMVAEFPQVNRFVMNKRLYARNEIAVGMVVLKPGTEDGTMNKIYFDQEDTIFDVSRKLDEYVEQNRKAGDTNSTDSMIRLLLSVPGLANFAMGLFRLMDRYGLLPRSVLKASPFHISMVLTNLASIRTNHIYHHIYDFGTTGQAVAMGNLREVPRRTRDGSVQFERCIPLGVVMDERICSGSYYARAFARMRECLKNPVLLEKKPEVVIREYLKPKKAKKAKKPDGGE